MEKQNKIEEIKQKSYILRKLIQEFYSLPGNCCGGPLHIILDDFNIRDQDLVFCFEELTKSDSITEKVLGNAILFLLSSFSPAQRWLFFDYELIEYSFIEDFIDVENKNVEYTPQGYEVADEEWNRSFDWLTKGA